MKIICTTSDKYHHILKIFVYLFNKNWGNDAVEIVGYKKPDFELPENFSFHSMGVQMAQTDFTKDLRKYFINQDQFFIWMMEDTFIKSVDKEGLEVLKNLPCVDIGRINLTGETMKQIHGYYGKVSGRDIYHNPPQANYRLSTQPSIWNRDFALLYMRRDLTPWQFEKQDTNDSFKVLGPEIAVLNSNEGVRKFDLNKFNLDGIVPEQIEEMKTLKLIL